MRQLLSFLLLLVPALGIAQQRFYVFFPDKPAASLQEVALSPRAMEHRNAQGIEQDQLDLPVDKNYLKALTDKGCSILRTSRWLNAALVTTHLNAEQLRSGLPRNWKVTSASATRNQPPAKFHPMTTGTVFSPGRKTTSTFNYGLATDQNSAFEIEHLHDQGYTGKDVLIAFLDAGYQGMYNNNYFDSLHQNQRLIDSRDYWSGTNNVFHTSDHGTMVTSIVVANLPGVFVGMAPHAKITVALTDDYYTETHQDEFYYVAGLEWADSMGADLVSASVSYLDFDSGVVDYNFQDMDGKTTIVAQGARIAARKGMLIVNSAGNTAGAICSPCDVDSLLCVGGAMLNLSYDQISSGGPTYDGRLKPDVAGITMPVMAINGNAAIQVMQYGGTSSATPMISGLAACLKQKHPTATNIQLITAIEQSGHIAATPNNQIGHGVPNARRADSILSVITGIPLAPEITTNFDIYPNPFSSRVNLRSTREFSTLVVTDLQGRIVFRQAVNNTTASANLEQLPEGLYLIQVSFIDGSMIRKKLQKY